ncbi:aspartate/glutamate racemase family protein [Tumebacillus permanentifrigoris]|uniref:Aspartate racemase n=1 Tax=Tumebacillus permanentifrigoris TaxID=378543 RepID=A0A316DCV3_9BACL|nr:aspartate/glutamate racemase family protein [Tumebacillus permanentifrigoris]PWK15795.1 aspartate racemase [Tumebacillus permanentifrigoris]
MKQKLVGILGGMGPFASAEFVNTIYEQNLNLGMEQNKPRVVLCSDPSIPDRTSSIEAGTNDAVTQKLISLWEQMSCMGIEVLIIPCITSHYYVQQYPEAMREMMVNLVTLTLDEVERSDRTYLLFATNGSYRTRLLEHERILIPSVEDQVRIHELLYTMKQYGSRPDLLRQAYDVALSLVEHYGADGWISGCTEFHLLTRYVMREQEAMASRILDPLMLVARAWPQFAF